MKFMIFILFIVLVFSGCDSKGLEKQQAQSIRTEVARLDSEIAEAERAKEQYSGVLVNALMSSRIEILKQTRAMLQQRSNAWRFGIAMKYAIDGKQFTLPDGAAQLLPDLEKQLEENKAKIQEQEKTVSLYSGGLVQALSLS